MESIRVLVTGIGGGGFGEQILKALKMSDIELFIIGTDITKICFNKDMVDEYFIVPPVSDDEKYKDTIDELIRKYKIQAIFPGSEPELKFFSNNRSEFLGVFIGINNKNLIDICLNKYKTYEFLLSKGLLLPKYDKINVLDDCKRCDYFPVVLKPNTGSGGSSNIFVAFNNKEMEMFVQYMLDKDIDIVAQQYVGDSDNEYTIGVSSDNDGNVLGCAIMKRIIKNGLSISKRYKDVTISSGISQGQFIHDEIIEKQAIEIAKMLNSTGPLNIQGRLIGERLMIFEINPRLSGTTSLRALAQYNEPVNMIKLNLLKQECEYFYSDKIVLRSLVEKEYT